MKCFFNEWSMFIKKRAKGVNERRAGEKVLDGSFIIIICEAQIENGGKKANRIGAAVCECIVGVVERLGIIWRFGKHMIMIRGCSGCMCAI